MHTFTNVSTSRLKVLPSPLPTGCTLLRTEQVDGAPVYVVKSTETITVPTTVEELVNLATTTTDTVEMDLGGKTFTLNVVVASYIRDQKLQSQQGMQAALRSDNKTTTRQYTFAWYMSQGGEQVADGLRRMKAAGTNAAAGKSHNAWLDEMYASNKDAVDEYAKKS